MKVSRVSRIAAAGFFIAFLVPAAFVFALFLGHVFYYAFTGVLPDIHVSGNRIATGCLAWFILFMVPSFITLYLKGEIK